MSGPCLGFVCDGDYARYCSRDAGQGGAVNCALTGRPCLLQGGFARCSTGPACDAFRCAGQALVTCLNSLEGPSFACPTGTTCTALTLGGYCAPPAGSACTPASGVDRCEGTILHFCAAGKETTVDCAAVHAFWTCKADLAHPNPTCAPRL